MNTREKGRYGESLALNFLRNNNIQVIELNYYFKGGEIDIIGWDKNEALNYLCFIEVKARKSLKNGFPEEAVDYRKQKRIFKGAENYMLYKKIPFNTPVRFDVISIINGEIRWIKNAFTG